MQGFRFSSILQVGFEFGEIAIILYITEYSYIFQSFFPHDLSTENTNTSISLLCLLVSLVCQPSHVTALLQATGSYMAGHTL